jgi:4-carboxymuconolactone decarboxylase
LLHDLTGRRTPRLRIAVPADASAGTDAEGWASVDYPDRLRALGFNDARFAEGAVEPVDVKSLELEPKTLELVRLAALVAVGGAVPSYGAQADAAVNAGATAAEIVDVLVCHSGGGAAVRGRGAPKLALALGYDLDEALE